MRPPAGGGVQYEPLNLLQPKFPERVAGTEPAPGGCRKGGSRS